MLRAPSSAVELDDGSLIISDTGNHCLRWTDPGARAFGTLTTMTRGWVDGCASESSFNEPTDMVLQGDKLFVADRGNHVVRIIELCNTKEADDATLLKSLRQEAN